MLRLVSYALVASILFIFSWVDSVEAAALSTRVATQEESCFYTWVDQQYEKVGFYFAVQEGGNFDIDYSVLSPSNRVIVEGVKSSQEDFVFTGNEMGEYRFCFHNHATSHGEKLVDFDITVESEPRLELPLAKAALLREQSTPVEDSMSNIDGDFTAIERTLRYFRMRENQGYSLVELTRFIEGLFVISISLGQVYIVRLLLNRGSSFRSRV